MAKPVLTDPMGNATLDIDDVNIEDILANADPKYRRDVAEAIMLARKSGDAEAWARVASILGSAMDARRMGVAEAVRANALPGLGSYREEGPSEKVTLELLRMMEPDNLNDIDTAARRADLLQKNNDLIKALVDATNAEIAASGTIKAAEAAQIGGLLREHAKMYTGETDIEGLRASGKLSAEAIRQLETLPTLISATNVNDPNAIALTLHQIAMGVGPTSPANAAAMEQAAITLGSKGLTLRSTGQPVKTADDLFMALEELGVDTQADSAYSSAKDSLQRSRLAQIEQTTLSPELAAKNFRQLQDALPKGPYSRYSKMLMDLFAANIDLMKGGLTELATEEEKGRSKQAVIDLVVETGNVNPATARKLIETREAYKLLQEMTQPTIHQELGSEEQFERIAKSPVGRALTDRQEQLTGIRMSDEELVDYIRFLGTASKRAIAADERASRLAGRAATARAADKDRRAENILGRRERLDERAEKYRSLLRIGDEPQFDFDPKSTWSTTKAPPETRIEAATAASTGVTTPSPAEAGTVEPTPAEDAEDESAKRTGAFLESFRKRTSSGATPREVKMDGMDMTIPGAATWQEEAYADNEQLMDFSKRLLADPFLQTKKKGEPNVRA